MRPSTLFRTIAFSGLTAAALALFPAAAHAGDRVEITPTFGSRTNPIAFPTHILCITSPCPTHASAEDAATLGLIVDVPISASWTFELRVDHQSSDVELRDPTFGGPVLGFGEIDTTTITVGALYGWSVGGTEPFVAFGAGVASIDRVPFFAPFDLEGEHLAISLGGGVKLFPEKRLGLRLEARGLWIDLPSRVEDGVAVEATSGFIVRF